MTISAADQSNRNVLTITQLNRSVRQLLETHMALLWVEGEISNFSRPSSGHWYFTLKDSQAQVKCAMFANRNNRVRFRPENGQKVLVRARVSLYEGRGDFQLIAEHVEEAGFGALQRAFEELKAKLQTEGLFAQEHKRTLPVMPQHIGVITSPTGAAIRDILTVLKRRFAGIPVTVIPVPVQGQAAAPAIARAIDLANATGLFDVLIVGRGGGSLEDLWPFNEEIVARAIYNSAMPIVSAVGHEVDFTIADFVADVRAATPSAAAELLSPNQSDWLNTFKNYENQLIRLTKQHIKQLLMRTQHLRTRLRHPGIKLQHQSQALDQLELRLTRAMKAQLKASTIRQGQLNQRLKQLHPQTRINLHKQTLTYLNKQIQQGMRSKLHELQLRFQQQAQRLNTVSPLNTLERGYAIVTKKDGSVVQKIGQVTSGEDIVTRLSDGKIYSQVKSVINLEKHKQS